MNRNPIRAKIAPILKEAANPKMGMDAKYEHPAFGLIGMSIVSGGSESLFGSDVGHGQRVRLTIKHAEHQRGLSNDWYHARGLPIVEVEMSHSQFAEFITSPNRGEGVPCTISEVDGVMMPSIEKLETKNAMLCREVGEAAAEKIKRLQKEIDRLGLIVEAGKFPKAEMRQIYKDLAREADQLPGSITFVVKQGEEAIERATTHAKIEIEATIERHISRIGLSAAREIGIVPSTALIEDMP